MRMSGGSKSEMQKSDGFMNLPSVMSLEFYRNLAIKMYNFTHNFNNGL